jgi:hypothetical protein
MRARGVRRRSVLRRPGSVGRGARWLAILGLALAVSACGLSGPSSGPGESSVASASPSGSPSGLASGSPDTSPSPEPTVSPSDTPTASPTDQPTPTETAGGPSASPVAGGAGCFGSADTRSFFETFAQDVSWPVYCAVLPKGWSVVDGTYRLANGGRLTITYNRRADGARIVLDEGSVCAVTNPCVPAGDALGSIPFGDRQADLSSSPPGASEPSAAYAATVDETENPAWVLTGTGISAKDFKSIADKLIVLDL